MALSRVDYLREYLKAIGPYRDQLVVIGGWVPFIYSRYYGWNEVDPPLMTADFDIAVMRTFEDKMPSIDESIRSLGYSYNFKSLDNPPVVSYEKHIEDTPDTFEIQFVVQSRDDGSGVDRIGSLNAEALPFIDILERDPIEWDLADLGLEMAGSIRVPKQGAFVLHKVLVSPTRRDRNKREKDLYYAFYVLDSFPRWEEEMRRSVLEICENKKGYGKRAKVLLDELFKNADAPGVDAVLRQRPNTAYPNMDDDQFRQYVHATMNQCSAWCDVC